MFLLLLSAAGADITREMARKRNNASPKVVTGAKRAAMVMEPKAANPMTAAAVTTRLYTLLIYNPARQQNYR